MTHVTCALPTYNSAPILWLQLESLCRQVDAPPFEVVIYEERSDDYAGEAYVRGFEYRLRLAGCKEVCYVRLRDRMSLAKKWRYSAHAAKSSVFLFCASDNYSPPDRLRTSYEAITSGSDWFDMTAGHFYNIQTGDMALYERPIPERLAFGEHPRSGLFMATRTDCVSGLPDNDPPIGIDAWIKRHMPIERHTWRDGPMGLHTDGHNQISHYRKQRYAEGRYEPPFSAPTQPLAECVPFDVARRLEAMREVARCE